MIRNPAHKQLDPNAALKAAVVAPPVVYGVRHFLAAINLTIPYQHEVFDECGYCIDALPYLPGGSTVVSSTGIPCGGLYYRDPLTGSAA